MPDTGPRSTSRRAVAQLAASAVALGSVWFLAPRPAPDGAVALSVPVDRSPAETSLAAPRRASQPLRRSATPEPLPPRAPSRNGAEPLAEPASVPEAPTETEHYERLLRDGLPADPEAVLRGDRPAPEKVALLRALLDTRDERAVELTLLAVRELDDVSRSRGESVPSTALLLLDRRAARDVRAREALRRVAFEVPLAPPTLRGRAAASYFLNADEQELLACRGVSLARESDRLVLDSALEALARNPHSEASARLLAPYARTPDGTPPEER